MAPCRQNPLPATALAHRHVRNVLAHAATALHLRHGQRNAVDVHPFVDDVVDASVCGLVAGHSERIRRGEFLRG